MIRIRFFSLIWVRKSFWCPTSEECDWFFKQSVYETLSSIKWLMDAKEALDVWPGWYTLVLDIEPRRLLPNVSLLLIRVVPGCRRALSKICMFRSFLSFYFFSSNSYDEISSVRSIPDFYDGPYSWCGFFPKITFSLPSSLSLLVSYWRRLRSSFCS